MKKHIKFILIPVLILVLILPMVVFGEQGKRRAGAEEVTETTEQVSEESTDSSEIKTLASSDPVKNTEKKSKRKETKLPKPRAGVEPIDGTMTLAEHKAEYGAIYQQANDDYNTAHGFNPLAKVVEVDTYSSTTSAANPYGYGFIEALRDESVTKITMLKNIKSTANVGTISARKGSIEIDGGGFELLLERGGFGFATPDAGENPVFHLHDMVCLQTEDAGNGWVDAGRAFVGNNNMFGVNSNYLTTSSDMLKNWYFRFGNIETKKMTYFPSINMRSRINGTFAAVDQCEVSLYGHNVIYTNSSSFLLGSLQVEPSTIVRNELSLNNEFLANYLAAFVFKKQADDATGESGEFNIGKNAYMYIKSITHLPNPTYNPYWIYPFLGDYSKIIVDEDAWLNTFSSGPAIAVTDEFCFDSSRYKNKEFHAKQNAKLNFGMQHSTDFNVYLKYQNGLMYFDSANYNFKMDFYAKDCDMVNLMNSNGSGYSITIRQRRHNGKFVIDNPKLYAIGFFPPSNNAAWAEYYGSEVYLNSNNSDNEVVLKNVDVGVRPKGVVELSNLGFAEQTRMIPPITGNGPNNVTSTNPAVQTALSGWNQASLVTNGGDNPKVTSEYITDAQKSYQAKAEAGILFTGKFDDYGMPIFEESPLTSNDKVDFLDTRNNTRPSITIESDGYAKYTDTEFQLAGKEVKATLKRSGKKASESTTTVLDVTPPKPIKVTGDKITVKNTELTAKVEPNAKVFISKNDGILVDAGTADASGNWSYTIPGGGYSEGDKIQIFLEDTTAALPSDFNQTGLEDTRTIGGNRNPKDGDVTYKDATFKQATIYHVQKGNETLKFHVRQMAVSPSVPIKEIVTPKDGYVTLKNTNDVKFDMKVKSGVESTGTPGDSQEAPFKDFSLLIPDPDTNNFLDLSAVIPSNYEYAGYAVTDTNVNHQFSSANAGNYQFDYSGGVYEKWITIFIKPNRGSEDTVGFYHWDYELNKFGKIK